MVQYSNWSIKRLLNALPYITISGAILLLLKITWMRWGDFIIDIGRDAYIPLEILKGKVLYSDIFYTNGPFPIYFHTLLFKLFGAHINVLIACGISTTFIISILLYKISRLFINPVYSSLIPFTFIFVCAFGNYVYLNNYNFVLPYTQTATYGILFSIAALYCFIKFVYYKSLIYLVFYSIFTSLVSLCKIEVGLPLLFIAIPILFYRPINSRRDVSILIYLSSIAIVCIIYGLFCLKTNLSAIIYKNFAKITIDLPVGNNYFAKWLIGTSNLAENTLILFYTTLSYIFILMCFLSFDYILNNLENNMFIKFFITFTIYLITYIIIIFFKNFMGPYIQYRVLPIICFITIVICLFKLYIKRDNKTNFYFSIFAIALFSLFLTSRTILWVSAAHYGFYILVPGLISYYLFFFNIIPEFFKKFTRHGFYYFASLTLFSLLILNHFNFYSPIYNKRTLKISGKRGSVYYLNNILGIRYRDLIDYLINTSKPNETLIVIPEGIDINFFTGMDNPLFYNSYMPSILELKDKELDIISQIYKNKVDYIVILQRDTTEFGLSGFGIDYGKELFNWIKKNYEVIKTLGPTPFTTDEFGIAVMKRKAV